MPAPEPLGGHRIVAAPSAIDAFVGGLPAGTTALRFAPDEVLVLGASAIHIDDPHAVVEDEVGFVAVPVEREAVERHTDWLLPAEGAIAQGAIAGVPAKLAWLPDGRAWVVTHAAYLADLLNRLG